MSASRKRQDWEDIRKYAKPLAAAFPIAFPEGWTQARKWLSDQYDNLRNSPETQSITGPCMLYRNGDDDIELWVRPETAFDEK